MWNTLGAVPGAPENNSGDISREQNQAAVRGIPDLRAEAYGEMASPLSPEDSYHYRIRLF